MKPKLTPEQALVELRHRHAGGCEGIVKRKGEIRPCLVCEDNRRFFAAQPPARLALMLEDTPVPTFKTRFADLAFGSFDAGRKYHNLKSIDGKPPEPTGRALRDCKATSYWIAHFIEIEKAGLPRIKA